MLCSSQDLARVGNGKQHFYRNVDERRGHLWNQKQRNKGKCGLKKCKHAAGCKSSCWPFSVSVFHTTKQSPLGHMTNKTSTQSHHHD